MIDSQRVMARTQDNLMLLHRIPLQEASPAQLHMALGRAVMEEIAPLWRAAEARRAGKRQACYLSAEYLIGRQVFNNLYCAGVLDQVGALFEAQGAPLAQMEDIEDAALGNGGLGRLAACYLDSAAALDLPLVGYGLRYRYGLFKQLFQDSRQKEEPDDWTRQGDPWSVRREELAVVVPMKGLPVKAVPYDMPVLGYRNGVVGTLRLWQTESLHEIDFDAFNAQRYAQASKDKNRAEDIVKFLYPNDDQRQGKLMRLKQQYVLSSASIQDMLRQCPNIATDFGNFSRLFAVQLNDTHPVMAIPELIRLLMEKGLGFDRAFEIARDTFSYTNHTVMREALEVWDEGLLAAVAPQLIPVLRRIDQRLRGHGWQLSVIREGRVHMAELAVYASHAVNGVARIHTQILKDQVFREWYERYPQRFLNVTNGITQRRWLGLCNPELTALLKDTLGSDRFLTDLNALEGLRDKITPALCRDFLAVKAGKKKQLAQWVKRSEGVELEADFLFDVQVKRLHEYKRQLMNGLCILAMYRMLKAGQLPDFTPACCVFGAKAAPGYRRAKAVISLINQLAAKINADPEVRDKLRVVFVANYNCTWAERIIPAADISQQISPAGTEASGTGNMKLMLNGALTLGTLDGANVEIVEQAGRENNFIFGATVEEIQALAGHYEPRRLYEADELLRQVVDALDDGTFQDPEGDIAELKTALLDGASWHAPDHYFVLKDFRPYLEARLKAYSAYRDREGFARMALYNIAGAGKFSSDRSVADYARDIWSLV